MSESSTFCYWSIADGPYVEKAEALIASARRHGVFHQFHIWANQSIAGAIVHPLGELQKVGRLFKFSYLRDCAAQLPFEHLIWIDADSLFVRHPGDPLRLLQGSPVHAPLGAALNAPDLEARTWWNCPVPEIIRLMRAHGIRNKNILSASGGLFIIHREAISTFYDLALEFWTSGRKANLLLYDEPLIAYAAQMLCGNPGLHKSCESADFWAPDYDGRFREEAPRGVSWTYRDPFSQEEHVVNPAMVHLMSFRKPRNT